MLDRDWESWLARKGVLGDPLETLAERGVPRTLDRCLLSGVDDLESTAWVPTWLNLLGKRFSEDFLALAINAWFSGVDSFSALDVLGVPGSGVFTLGVTAFGVLTGGVSTLGVLGVATFGDLGVLAFGVSTVFLGVFAFLVIVIVSGELAWPVEDVEEMFSLADQDRDGKIRNDDQQRNLIFCLLRQQLNKYSPHLGNISQSAKQGNI